MTRRFENPGVVLLLISVMVSTGCRPQQPFYFCEDGDLSHYIGVATDIEYPDVETSSLDEVNGALPPLTLENSEPSEVWELPLEEAMRMALCNSKVMRNLGGVVFGATGTQGEPTGLTSQPQAVPSIYDPARQETNPAVGGGPEQALAAFDARFTTSVFWEKNDTPRNIPAGDGFAANFLAEKQDVGNFRADLQKTAATGGTWTLRHNVVYDLNHTFFRVNAPSDWAVNLEAEFNQPLLQGAGVQFNRIAGPSAFPGFNNGVVIARLRTDQTLADFEAAVRDLVRDVERAYWELYYAYRSLDAAVDGRDAVLQLWRERKAEEDVGKGGRSEEAQARQQYFLFRSAAERSQSNLFRTENHLRYLLGLASTDGRLIRPSDEPTTAGVQFDWYESHAEGMVRSVELRKQKWVLKQRELELIAAKNYLLPRLDAVGRYRWLGLGDDLLDPNGSGHFPLSHPLSNAYGSMTSGNFQEWHLGLDLSVPIGFRREMAGVRHAQLNLARDRVVFQEQELELSHQLGHAFRALDEHYVVSQTNFNRRVAADDELETVRSKYEYGQRDVTFAQVLDAQRRLAESEIDYFRSVVDYNLAINQVHLRKGSLLEYNGVCLSEGPWPGKAYFDATRRARARDASFYLDYGFTRPTVQSRGPYQQHMGSGASTVDPSRSRLVDEPGEVIPTPDPLPMGETTDPLIGPMPTDGSGGPKVNGTEARRTAPSDGSVQWVAADKARGLDVGRLDLASLGSKKKAAGSAGKSSDVQKVSYSEPRSRAAKQWTNASRSDTRNEPLANRTPAEADRSASGWKGVQH